MEPAPLFEEKVDTERGRSWVTIRVELGGDGAIQLAFEGRETPAVIFEYDDPSDVSAIGEALVRAADIARRSVMMEAG